MKNLATARPSKNVWGWPIAIGLITCAGLGAALLGAGVWDAISWIALAIPVAVSAWYWKF
jgi:hypothetical protein